MTTRRNFLKSTGALATTFGVSSILSSQIMASINKSAPSDRVNIAVIGVGMGCADLNGILQNNWAHCAGMCDVNQERLEAQAAD
ncbi:MAG: twin-arginine translocation signal domain-containing protein, partial [Dysgonamonadaceae bacterium]|nr:twin-arginine translocation signal domain-containing protein [Dysgonamonadaceae bacterium]